MQSKGDGKIKRYVDLVTIRVGVSIAIISLLGCSNSNNSDGSKSVLEPTSTWKLSEPAGSSGIFLELGSSHAMEYHTIPAGRLCRESATVDSWRILYGDEVSDEVIGIEYVNATGVTITAEVERQREDIFQYSPLCVDSIIWNGVYKQNGSYISPEYFWSINVPITQGYYWDELNNCYQNSEISVWRMTSLYAGDPNGMVFDAVYEKEGASYVAYLSKTDIVDTEIAPICIGS